VTDVRGGPRYRRSVDDALDLIVPPELEAGVTAEWFRPWFSRHQLTVDFAAPVEEGGMILTARVRVPVTAVFRLQAGLAEAINRYELEFGEIRWPRRRDEE
jgi:hypothetical protein